MYRLVNNIDELKRLVETDKEARGIGANSADRYPIRFVLLDNFRDCADFVEYLQQERGVRIESVEHWIDNRYPDLMISSVELAEHISQLIKSISPADCAIAPFSELARFYDNTTNKCFDTLIKTIKAIESSPRGYDSHQRVYIPIVGLEGKMDTFRKDTQINIWRLKSEENELIYRLTLIDGNDYGVKGLEQNFTVVSDIRQWLNIWQNSKQQTTCQIISLSRSIYANAQYAQPDNAFSFHPCDNAYKFLTDGLQLSFGGIQEKDGDGDNWEQLAAQIDICEGFNFTKFVNAHFDIDNIDDYRDFMRLWFSHPSIFDRWLLARYYTNRQDANAYLCRVVEKTSSYGTNELIEKLIDDISELDSEMNVRRYCLSYAARQKVQLTEAAENLVQRRLTALADKIGCEASLKYFSGIARVEKKLLVSWLGSGKIPATAVKQIYPDLYCYMNEGVGVVADAPAWLEDYFKAYKHAKISNKYTDEVARFIDEKNASEASFDSWYNTYSDTYTLLKDRGDIEVFFWIDGLGIDWVPLVRKIISEHKDQQIFLNEVMIARAQLPTKTDNNKTALQRLVPGGKQLEKVGDLDTLAHQVGNISPFTISEELKVVRDAIEKVIDRFLGKKIAIVSDHGLTYLSQMVSGKNLAGVESDHGGRIAIAEKGCIGVDSSYFRLDDGRTLCALKHNSLCAKISSGQGCHGGCTPEEVLVPIFIISSCPAPTNWSVELLSGVLSGTNPRVKLCIKNLSSANAPYVQYNGKRYNVHQLAKDIYESDDLDLDANVKSLSVVVGGVIRPLDIVVNTGVVEDDLFNL